MAYNTAFDRDKLARMKELAKAFLKKFGPFIITGLAAVAEHHWLDHNDKAEEGTRPRERGNEPDHKHHPIKKLEQEVAELKRSLSRKVKDEVEEREERPYMRIREETVRERRPTYRREERRMDNIRDRQRHDERVEVRSQREYQEYQTLPPARREPQIVERSVRFRERDATRSNQHRAIQRRRRRRRPSPTPAHTSHIDEVADKTIQAGKVAAVAGFVEALHISNTSGDWIGAKGVRVGTTMAASFAASQLRDKDDTLEGLGPAVDVGAGLLVSEVVHGSSKRLEKGEKGEKGKRGRRWSYCY